MRIAWFLLPLALAGCGTAERLALVGRAPEMAPITDPTRGPDYRPVSMPMPPPQDARALAGNSLWRPGSRTFLRDQRAAAVGDLVTILVSIRDQAELQNTSARSRDNNEQLGIPRLLGLDSSYARLFPQGFDPSRAVQVNSENASNGTGSIRRTEAVTMRVAATVTQVLPNGNLVVGGRQQMRGTTSCGTCSSRASSVRRTSGPTTPCSTTVSRRPASPMAAGER